MTDSGNGRHHSLIKMLLTNQSPLKSQPGSASSSTSTCPSLGGTPNSLSNYSARDSEEETEFSKYLYRLSGQRRSPVNPVVHDHFYAKPWNWRPEHHFFKLTRNLFMMPIQSKKTPSVNDDIIDIETVDKTNVDFSFTIKNEPAEEMELPCEEESDWEDRVPKIGWTQIQHRLFQRFARLIELDRLSRLAVKSNSSAQMRINNHVKRSANRMRMALSSINWHLQLSRWINQILLTFLPTTHLKIYREIIKVLQYRLPDLVDRMIEGSSLNLGKVEMTDPLALSLREMKPLKALPGKPVFVIVPSQPNRFPFSPRLEQWCEHFKTLGLVIRVDVEINADQRMYTQRCVEKIITETRNKILEIQKEYMGKPIILVGWNAGATIALQVALSESKLTACVVMGLAVSTVQGLRGDPGDPFLDLRCPIIFVAGEKATRSRPDHIDDLRARIRALTGLIVIGSADDHFRVSRSLKTSLGISQAMIDFCMFQEVRNFINQVLTQPLPSSTNNDFTHKRERKNSKANAILTTTPIQVDASPIRRGPGRPSRGRRPKASLTPHSHPHPHPHVHPSTPSTSTSTSSSTAVPSHQQSDNTLSVKIGSIASLSSVGHIRTVTNNTNMPSTTIANQNNVLEDEISTETNPSPFTTVFQIQGRSNMSNVTNSEPARIFPNSRNKLVNLSKLVVPGKMVLTDGRKTLTSSASIPTKTCSKLYPMTNSTITTPSNMESIEETQIITEPVSPMLNANDPLSPDEILSLPIIFDEDITNNTAETAPPDSTDVFSFDLNEDIQDDSWSLTKPVEDQSNYSSMVLIKGGHSTPPIPVAKRKYRKIFLPTNQKILRLSDTSSKPATQNKSNS